MQVSKVWCLLIVVGLFSCNTKELKPKDYINYIKSEESNCYKKREVGEFIFEVFYQPIDYKIAQKIKNEEVKNINDLRKEIEGMQYYTLKISPIEGNKSILKYNLQSEEDYQARLAYFSFGMQKDIYVETEENKIACSLYHFERAYDLSNYRIFDLAFEESEENKEEDKTLVIRSDFFGTGRIKFKFKDSDLKDLPKLIIE